MDEAAGAFTLKAQFISLGILNVDEGRAKSYGTHSFWFNLEVGGTFLRRGTQLSHVNFWASLSSLISIQRLGHWADNYKMDYWSLGK